MYDHTPLDSLRERLGAKAVNYAQGCDFIGNSTAGFAPAIALAKSAKVALVFLGLNGEVEDEGKDRKDIDLPGKQEELVQAITTTGTPVIVVLVNGGAIAIDWLKASNKVMGIVEAW